MTRVDEALRRALEQGAEGVTTVEDVARAMVDAEVSVRADEAYPVEIAEHRRTRAAVVDAPAPPAAPVPFVGRTGSVNTSAPADLHAVAPPAGRSGSMYTPARSAAPGPSNVPPAVSSAPVRLIERIDTGLAEKIVVDHNMPPASREQYRRLAGALHHAQERNGIRIVMVTSAVPGEGKTLTSSNLALTFSESYQRKVLLIDGDLRRPSLHTVFRLDNRTGLSDGLASREERPMPVQQVSPRLAVLPAGPPMSDPMAGLTSERMHRLLREAREAFDWVIIDTPPVALLPDANLLVSMSDGALLVIKAESTPYELVKRAADALGSDRTLGVVLNRAITSLTSGKYGYYVDSYYGERPQAPAPTT